MLKINPAPTFEFDAQLTVPGQAQSAVVRITAHHRGREALQAWIDSAAGSADAQFLGAALADWSGVLDAAGAPMPYSAQALAQLLDAYPAAGRELFEQYLGALTESRRKKLVAAAEWLYAKPPDAAELEIFGAGAFAQTAPELWPDTAAAVELFCMLGTQWRMGPGGHLYGLDHAAVLATMRMLNVPRSQWPQMLADLGVLERAALEQMRP